MQHKEMHVLGGFKTWQGANVAVQRLVDDGRILRSNIGVLMAEQARENLGLLEKHTRAAEGATIGGITGGVLGGIAIGLTAVAAVSIPGLGLFAAGPIVAALAGFGAGAAAGGALGGLVGLGLTEYEVKAYQELLKANGVVVTVSTFDKEIRKRCEEILRNAGALNVETESGQMINLQARM